MQVLDIHVYMNVMYLDRCVYVDVNTCVCSPACVYIYIYVSVRVDEYTYCTTQHSTTQHNTRSFELQNVRFELNLGSHWDFDVNIF